MKLSVIIPVYNGSRTIGRLVEAVHAELRERYELEVVLVNDGSQDNSAAVCAELARSRPWVVFLDLSCNFGEHNAVMAGLHHCHGDAAAIVDDDFQNPPAEIGKLVEKLREGYDVVFAGYPRKCHHPLRNLGSRFNNAVATFLIRKPYGLYLSSFKAINRFVIDQLRRCDGPYPYVDGLILRVTDRYATVVVQHDAREEGRSGYSLHKLMSLWGNMSTSFSVLPLRIATVLGLVCSVVGLLAAGVFVLERFFRPHVPIGWASLSVSLFVLSGAQLFALGMVGEYLGRLYMRQGGKPQYVVRQSLNCGERPPPP